jgi:hypothetical protein
MKVQCCCVPGFGMRRLVELFLWVVAGGCFWARQLRLDQGDLLQAIILTTVVAA